jgi:PAS domain S-box-containing protein
MKDPSKTKQKLIEELSVLKQRMQELEYSESDRKQAEKALRESEEKYRNILESIQEGYFELDLAGNYTFANEANCRYLGYTKEELVGMNFRQHTDEEAAKKFRQPLQELYRTGKPINTLESETIRKDGTKAIYETSVSLIRDNKGKPIGFRGVSRDVTKRKNMEEVLRQSEERYRTIIENIEDGYFEVDLTGTLTFVNDAQCRNVGTPREQLLGMNNRDYTSEEEAKKLYQLFIGIYITGEPVKGFAFEYKKRDGTMAFAELSVSLIRDAESKPIGFRGISRDVTERKRAEEALRVSEEKYRLVVENAKEPIIIAQDLKLVFVNRAAVDMIGYSGELLGFKPFTDFIHPDDRNMVVDYHIRRLKGEEVPLAYSFRVITQDGTVKWVEFNTALIQWEERPATLSFLNDITERKQAEETLRKSEANYRQLFDNSPTGIYQIDFRTGKFLKANDLICEYLGCSQEEITSLSPYDFITKESQELLLERLSKMAIGDKIPEDPEYEVIDKNGKHRWLKLNSKNIYDSEGLLGADVVAHDITERKRAEEALRESEARYRLLADNMTDAVWLMDMNLNVIYASPSVEKLIGYTDEQIKQMPKEKFLTPESLNKAIAVFLEELVKAKADPSYSPMRTLELEFCRKEGTTYWGESTFSFIRDEKGIPWSVLAEARDITDRKRVEEERKRLEERLQRAHKMEAIGTLAGGIAHDFNNLLMAIQGYTSLTLLTLAPDDPNRERLKIIQEQVQSGADLTRQLLGFARGGRYEVKPADINDVIQKTSSMFGRTKKEITIHMKYEKNLSPVEVDLGQMEQVFMNLYVNAWQAMPGGGEIYLQTENVFLNNKQALSYSVKPGKYVKITVTDTGTGIDEKTRERIFDPFFTTKAMGRGAGLGLATVYGIIKGHKGMINVYSEPGHGTTFTIYLPASEKEVVKKETATGTIDRGTETILLVDDEKIVLEANREMLESMGYRVYAVGSGQEAIALFTEKRNEIDLVILDMIMPGISGGETFDRLREINSEIKVLLSSGYSLNGEAQTIMDRGCKGFIQKPFQIEKLSQKVREMLD